MELSHQARRALDALRRRADHLRFEVAEICHSGRWRLSVHYREGQGGELRLGLAYSLDREGLEELRGRLSEVEARRAAPPVR